MKKNLSYVLILSALMACNRPKTILPGDIIAIKDYPHAQKSAQKDIYFGTTVQDPYRWLEDDSSETTSEWIKSENRLSTDYLNQIPYREAMKERLKKVWNYEKYQAPFKEGDYTYFLKNNGLQNQWVMSRRKGNDGIEELFLDPNTFSKDGTASLSEFSFSRDGSLMAYQISEGGSDWTKIVIMKVSDKSIVGDTLDNVKFTTLAWKGNEGIFYGGYDRPKGGSSFSVKTDQHKLYFHKLNTKQSEDQLILGGASLPRRYILGKVTEDGRYLITTLANSAYGNELYIKDLNNASSKFITVVGDMKGNHDIIDIVGAKIYIRTDLDAPNGRLVVADVSNPIFPNWKDIIPQTGQTMQVTKGGGKFFASYLKDALSSIKQYDINGKFEHEMQLPDIGSASNIGVNCKRGDKHFYYYFTSYITPGTIYKYDIASGRSTLYRKSKVKFDPADYESKQIFYTSKDGTKIPMIITYKKGIKLDGNNPTLLHGYGGFGLNITPAFDIRNLILLEQGGILAVANLRGGGEYGAKWYLAGIKMNKQNVFDDFIAAAEYLIAKDYTSKQRLAIAGESNGGLLIGACMTQRPDLFKVAFAGVGVMDMIRFNKFTTGAGWTYDYGSPEDSKEMFEYLYRYSPYHALKPNTSYPATLVTTADHDDKVIPAHSFKFAARLQELNSGGNPMLIKIESNAGHGAGKSTDMTVNQQADKWAFMFHNMGLSYKIFE
ncbi:prolyl oligopeptidase family serine peptidase [Pedobacter mucosus]|uniref:prolyl oligopeptidase family serine peptidase n=1 Tax=Pedobacter mucosus TaxID=2895286 RepID=UPI001EE435D7|nr:prolyl oligopeptidase family serine peptidase [Pedobacter mucosus]UKT64996.1 prolyl oligopeptidase family serine peptidase [Pedobacter mucosus]